MNEGQSLVRLPPGHRHPLPDSTRVAPDQLIGEIQLVSRSPVVTALLDAVDTSLLVLNARRQIVAMNGRVAALSAGAEVMGLRPGDALACVNAGGPGGCGTAAACQTCGALGAILACERHGHPVEAECLMRTERQVGTAVEFNVRAAPVRVEGQPFTVVSLRDISAEKRREALEQIFFHDVLNTVAGLRGWVERLRRPAPDPVRAAERLDLLSRQLEREIRDHRALLLAENGTLVPSMGRVRAPELLHDLELVFSSHAASQDRRLEIAPPPEVELMTDRSLLLRVLVNMVRNALEAAPPGTAVRVSCEVARDAVVRFSVRNEGLIAPEVQARIFQRSFSTKARQGRGLGTYSMKLLGERYLGGAVSFDSTVEAGTVFQVQLPLSPPRLAMAAS